MIMKKFILWALVLSVGIFSVSPESFAQPGGGCWREGRPYGGYYRGPRWGWYGARTQVKTASDARTLLSRYFDGQDLVIGEITERKWHFEAAIKDNKGNLVDRVLLDRRTGRIRSIY
jgi:hypothetical protein